MFPGGSSDWKLAFRFLIALLLLVALVWSHPARAVSKSFDPWPLAALRIAAILPDESHDPLGLGCAREILEAAREQVLADWDDAFGIPLIFTNAPGSAADLDDLADAVAELAEGWE